MERLLRRYVWVVDLIGIAIGAALAGDAASTLIVGTLVSHVGARPPKYRPSGNSYWPPDTTAWKAFSPWRAM